MLIEELTIGYRGFAIKGGQTLDLNPFSEVNTQQMNSPYSFRGNATT